MTSAFMTESNSCVPADSQRPSPLERRPRVVGQHRDAFAELGGVVARRDPDHMPHAGNRARARIVHGHDARAERCVQNARDEHPRPRDVDPEPLRSARDRRRVHVPHASADDPEILSALERDVSGDLHGGRFGRQLAEAKPAAGFTVNDSAVLGPTRRALDVPSRGGGGQECMTRGRAGSTQRDPVRADASTAARELSAEPTVEWRLHHANLMPRHVELFGHDHRERGLRAGTDLGVLRRDGDDAVSLDLDERADLCGRGGSSRSACTPGVSRRKYNGNAQPAGGGGADANEAAPIEQ